MSSVERKAFNLQRARMHRVKCGFSNMVVLRAPYTPQFIYIKYDNCFLDHLGKVLPRGLNYNEPSFLSVNFNGTFWRVVVQYLDKPEKYILWDSPSRPTWIPEARKLTKE